MKKLMLLGLLLTMCFHYVKAQEVAYRPIVEEGKVWKVGWIPSGSEFGNVAQVIAYFWLEEVVDSATCAWLDRNKNRDRCMKLMKEYVCNDEYIDRFPQGTQECFDIFEDSKSHEILAGYVTKNPDGWMYYLRSELLYYFYDNGASFFYSIGDRDYDAYIRDVNKGVYANGFKGLISTVVSEYVDFNTPDYYEFETIWLEGVGSVYGPYPNIIDPTITPIEWYLMECRVGDDVLYYNPDIIDGVNPPDEETKKRIDFTHIEKPRPRAPHRAATEESVSLNGEFSTRLLDLQLGDMSDTYNVTITDDADEVVYQKTVRAADVLALNIDISEWAAPSYTINVENDYEQYVGTFELTPTGIEEKYQEQCTKDHDVYDLQGRRVIDSSSERGGARRAEGSLTKGLYIINGKKVLIK